MDYEIDLCRAHHRIRLTVTVETVAEELAEDIYKHLSEVTSSDGPYAAICRRYRLHLLAGAD